MPACAIRYRLDGSGPVTYLVDCDGSYHLYTRGTLGEPLSAGQIAALRAGRRWVPAVGELVVGRPATDRFPLPMIPTSAVGEVASVS